MAATAKEILGGKSGRGMGTPLAEYDETGPYHCEDCHFLKGRNNGKDSIFRDAKGKGRCDERHMIKDPKTVKDSQGRPIVDIEKGCCRFVNNKNLSG